MDEAVIRKIKDLDRRIEAAVQRGTPGSIKAAGEMSRERSTLRLQAAKPKTKSKTKKKKKDDKKSKKLRIPTSTAT